ncbi:hypothetical protein MKZ38_007424 [Zalerion maritima]|uniref:Uncharacterized protein n=1 Tax=Zalerion maritima TaxID=339359 RepID=A0AAD5RWW8_9PEZI|nr:hypothetical protein MKZ38_007424 [Zalerion maritima]
MQCLDAFSPLGSDGKTLLNLLENQSDIFVPPVKNKTGPHLQQFMAKTRSDVLGAAPTVMGVDATHHAQYWRDLILGNTGENLASNALDGPTASVADEATVSFKKLDLEVIQSQRLKQATQYLAADASCRMHCVELTSSGMNPSKDRHCGNYSNFPQHQEQLDRYRPLF